MSFPAPFVYMILIIKIPSTLHISETGACIYKDRDRYVHREDGPAFIHKSGRVSYWLCGSRCDDIDDWAVKVLTLQQRPTDIDSIKEFLRAVMQKQTRELL